MAQKKRHRERHSEREREDICNDSEKDEERKSERREREFSFWGSSGLTWCCGERVERRKRRAVERAPPRPASSLLVPSFAPALGPEPLWHGALSQPVPKTPTTTENPRGRCHRPRRDSRSHRHHHHRRTGTPPSVEKKQKRRMGEGKSMFRKMREEEESEKEEEEVV